MSIDFRDGSTPDPRRPERERTDRDLTGHDLAGRDLTDRDPAARDLTARDLTGHELAGHHLANRALIGQNEIERDLIDRLRRGRAPLPKVVDERLMAHVRVLAMDSGGCEIQATEVSGEARRQSWRPFLAAAALLVVFGVGWRVAVPDLRGAGRSAASSAERLPSDGPAGLLQDPARPVVAPGAQEPAGPPTLPRGGARIALWAPIVAVVERADEDGVPMLRVLRWIKCPEGLVPEGADAAPAARDRFELVAGDEPGQRGLFLSFLDWQPCEPGRPMIVELDWADGTGDDPTRVKPVRTADLRGLPTQAEGYSAADGTPRRYATPHKALLAEVLRAAESPLPEVRRPATAALFSWMGQITTTELIPPTSLWEGAQDAEPGGSVAGRLLQLAVDPDPVLREIGAQGIPVAAGPAGRRTLYRLAFDPEPSVRRRALRSLRAFEDGAEESWLDIADGVGDTWWEEFTSSTSEPTWRQRAIEAAQSEGITDPVGIWERQFHKPREENHLLGALGLGNVGLGELGSGGSGRSPAGQLADGARDRALEILRAQREVRDPRVRAAAAVSRIQLGDESAWRDVRALALSDDPRAAVFALDRVRRIECLETLDLVDEICESAASPVVRAHAAAALHGLRSVALHRVFALLDDMQADPHPMVQVAAGRW